MLKACLVYKNAEIPRTHDLGRLLGDCLALGLALAHIADDCDLLTPYGAAIRYPGDEPDVLEEDGRTAVEAAKRIFAAAKAVII
jgi:HEPN domain-containing protein